MAEALVVRVATAGAMHALGRALAGLLRAGDLLVLTGDLGAGKTTLTQGIGRGLGVRGEVTSPTFVIARVHPGPLPLVHVDAYRLHGVPEVDDLDLDTGLDEAVTVVEWGEGLVESLAADRLEIDIRRAAEPSPGGVVATADGMRTVTLTAVGDRWTGDALRALGRAAEAYAGAP